jgi:cold shock CspA family protein
VFIHYSQLQGGRRRDLAVGSVIEFELGETERGPIARKVTVVNE